MHWYQKVTHLPPSSFFFSMLHCIGIKKWPRSGGPDFPRIWSNFGLYNRDLQICVKFAFLIEIEIHESTRKIWTPMPGPTLDSTIVFYNFLSNLHFWSKLKFTKVRGKFGPRCLVQLWTLQSCFTTFRQICIFDRNWNSRRYKKNLDPHSWSNFGLYNRVLQLFVKFVFFFETVKHDCRAKNWLRHEGSHFRCALVF